MKTIAVSANAARNAFLRPETSAIAPSAGEVRATRVIDRAMHSPQ